MFPAFVRDCYCRHRTVFVQRTSGAVAPYKPSVRYDGGKLRGIVYPSVWIPLEEFFRIHRLDAEPCIACRFRAADLRGRPPEPSEISDSGFLPAYLKEMRHLLQDATNELYAQQHMLAVKLQLQSTQKDAGDDALKLALLSEHQLSPLFQHCVAVARRHPSIAERCHGAAVQQFVKAPTAYSRAWKEILPEDFRHDAAETWMRLKSNSSEA